MLPGPPTSPWPCPPQQVFIEHLPCVHRGSSGLTWSVHAGPTALGARLRQGPGGSARIRTPGCPPCWVQGSVLTGVTLLPVIPGGWQSPACCYPPAAPATGTSPRARVLPSGSGPRACGSGRAAPGPRLPRKLRCPQQGRYLPRPRPAETQPSGEPWTVGGEKGLPRQDVLVSSSSIKGALVRLHRCHRLGWGLWAPGGTSVLASATNPAEVLRALA